MAEYIERKLLYKALTAAAVNDKFKSLGTWAKAICVLHDLPAADVVPVVHGPFVHDGRSEAWTGGPAATAAGWRLAWRHALSTALTAVQRWMEVLTDGC